MIDQIAVPALIWLGSLFVYSGSLKVLAPSEHNVRAVEGYKILPSGVARAVGLVLPYIELTVGMLILLTPFERLAALAAAAFGTAFAVAVGSVLLRGIQTGCGCAGKASESAGRATLVRGVLIAVAGVAVTVAGSPVPDALGWLVFSAALTPAGTIVLRAWLRRMSRSVAANATTRKAAL